MKRLFIKFAAACLSVAMVSNASAALIVSLDIDGNTAYQPFTLASAASNTANITSFTFDLGSLGLVFDPENGGAFANGNGVAFTPKANTGASTGLVSPFAVVDGSTSFTQFFTDFNPGEMFKWDIDVDFLSGTKRVDGDDLIGASLSVMFDDGSMLAGTFAPISGNSDASGFVATSFTSGSSVAVEEPAPFGILALSLALFGLARFRFNG
ncbi:hypothetical protein [Alteromonas sp.]|uniref:hypothetical protein n=1 Tax=Alteromonas sp. TaxID=232 RepID=UPI00257BADB3|nr:hypothetical protein [Alteromonas sp.]NQY17640.1 hypothetical protein [Alteromonas sp.]